SDSVFHFVDTIGLSGKSNMALDATLDITSSGDEFNFVIYAYDDTLATWLTVVDSVGRTPSTVTLTADGSGLAVGTYQNRFAVLGDETVCEPDMRFFHVTLEVVVDTTGVDSLCHDSMMVAEVMTVPGAPAMVPVDFTNCCDLSGIGVVLSWGSDYVALDSVSFVDSRLVDFLLKYDTIDNVGHRVAVGAANDGTALNVLPGTGNFVNLHFSVLPGAPHGFYEIGIYDFKCISCLNPIFSEDCGEGTELIIPGFEPGGILVDTTTLYFCGYVVDPVGNPIPEATVELWAGFPYGSPDDMTLTNSSGAFAFTGFAMPPFDLWAYHEGYYPTLVEDINALLSDDTTIVLYPVEPVTPTNEWVLFYCSDNTYMGEPLPAGSVVDAFDPEGTHCGTFFVEHAGSYGYLLAYGDDPYYPNDTTDEGAEPGDLITFTVNGIEALITGDPTWTYHGDSSEVCLEVGVVDTTYCDLFEGWNLVSWNLDQESDNIVDALASISGCVELVMGFEQGGLIYDPGLPEFSTLWEVDHLSGYWIKTSCNTTLEIAGMPVAATTPIALTAGWNLVSYLPDLPMATGNALASLGDKLIVALGYENDSGSVYLPGEDLYNSLDTMAGCLGYWVKVLQDTSLVYPGTFPVVTAPQKSHQPVMSAAIAGVTATNRWVNVFSRNLTLDGATIAAGATITAHNPDGRIIGSFTTIRDGQFGFMSVYADDNATTEIEGVRAGERFYLAVNGVAANETFVWTETGDRMEIGALTAKAGSQQVLPDGYSLNQNYPNPFNPSTNISFTLPMAGQARIDIYNILGKLVATPFDGTARTGENNIVWDGRNQAGENVATGIYFYRLTADNYVETKKMTLMK
ncbi:MAG: T9SS type A sorting domain-containing protein, partial [bacterium]